MRFSRVKIPEKFCEFCGERMLPKVYGESAQESMNEFSKRRFCGRKCWGESKRLPNGPKLGGLPHRGRKIARRTIDRDFCRKCMATERLEVHHVNGDATDNRIENLMVLCMKCHRSEHKKTACSIESCVRPHASNGFCSIHYYRWKKYGNPLMKKLNSHHPPVIVEK